MTTAKSLYLQIGIAAFIALFQLGCATDYGPNPNQVANSSSHTPAPAPAATPVSAISFSPASLNFGSVTVGATSAVQTLTFTNTGSADLIVSATTLNGSNFQWAPLTSTTCVIGRSYRPGSTCTMAIYFAPQSSGNLTGTLTVTGNAGNSPQVITLMGTVMGESPSGTKVPQSTQIVDSGNNIWTLSPSGQVLKNGTVAGSTTNAAFIFYYNRTIYHLDVGGVWWLWAGASWLQLIWDPRISPSGTTIPFASQIVDSGLNTWTLASSQVFVNGTSTNASNAQLILSYNSGIYYEATVGSWFMWSGSSWTAQATDPRSNPAWNNQATPVRYSTFTFRFDAVPTTAVGGEDSVIGLSASAAAAYTDLAVIVAFNASGNIQVRNGGVYAADVAIAYIPGMTYSFEFDVNIATHTYTVYVTPAGGTKTLLAQSYAFRSEQAGVASLANFANYSDVGGVIVSNASITFN